jgi:hypothetical protein
MPLQERCREAAARIARIQETLLEPKPEALDRCEAELLGVIGLLQETGSEARPTKADRAALLGLKQAIERLAAQVNHASNLCQGWAQLRLSMGYNEQGRPAMAAAASKASFEV